MASVVLAGPGHRERIRFAWARYGNFPFFARYASALARAYQGGGGGGYFEPWERRAQRYGQRFDTAVLCAQIRTVPE